MALDGYFDFAGYGEGRHALLLANNETFTDGIRNIGLGFRLGNPLTYTAWDGRAFGNKDAVFVFGYGDQKLHDFILSPQ